MISEVCLIVIAAVLVCFLAFLIIWNVAVYKMVRNLRNFFPHASPEVTKIDRDVEKLTKDIVKKCESESEDDYNQNNTIHEVVDWTVKTIILFKQIKRCIKQYGKSNR